MRHRFVALLVCRGQNGTSHCRRGGWVQRLAAALASMGPLRPHNLIRHLHSTAGLSPGWRETIAAAFTLQIHSSFSLPPPASPVGRYWLAVPVSSRKSSLQYADAHAAGRACIASPADNVMPTIPRRLACELLWDGLNTGSLEAHGCGV